MDATASYYFILLLNTESTLYSLGKVHSIMHNVLYTQGLFGKLLLRIFYVYERSKSAFLILLFIFCIVLFDLFGKACKMI